MINQLHTLNEDEKKTILSAPAIRIATKNGASKIVFFSSSFKV